LAISKASASALPGGGLFAAKSGMLSATEIVAINVQLMVNGNRFIK
jgi:hypothetical protein